MSLRHVSVRLAGEELERIDALIDSFSSDWRKSTRSDVLRVLILRSLPTLEAEVAQKGKSDEVSAGSSGDSTPDPGTPTEEIEMD